jgi:hypothetical protein
MLRLLAGLRPWQLPVRDYVAAAIPRVILVNLLVNCSQRHNKVPPTIPKVQSIILQNNGIPLTSPAISASGKIPMQAIMPN